jgi:large subunit ribosomal protein L37Ae
MHNSKYGKRIRDLVEASLLKKNERYECPKCGKRSVMRISNALWECRSCGVKIAGGAYSLGTDIGQTARRVLAGGEAGD